MDMRSLLLLSVLLALIREGEGEKPVVSLWPRFPQVYVGDDVTLICNRKGGSKPTIWYINDKAQHSHQDYLMVLTAVTAENNGMYECEQGGTRSDPYTLTVLELEPYAQLSPSAGGAVMTKGDGRNLVLQADDDLKDWACFVLREVSTFSLGLNVDETMNRAVIFAELKEAERATFWCKKKKRELRSNAVTLKKTELMVMLQPPAVPALQGEPVALRCVVWGGPNLENAIFYKDKKVIKNSAEGTYTIKNATQDDNGEYSCHATYRFIHISADAAQREGDSDAQELKVIGGPPAATLISESQKSLQCSCPRCSPVNCTSYHWYHTLFNDPYTRRKLSENDQSITVEEGGLYSCRVDCGKGCSRFSNVYSYKAQSESDTPNLMPIMVAVILIFLGLIIVLLVVLKRRSGGSSIQVTKRDKDKMTGGDYEQIQLKDKDQAVYHTLGESTNKDQAEGGYEALQKRQEEGVYHTLGPGEGQSEGQGGYEALKSVKAEVYQTLSSDDSKKPAGEAEGGYEQLPQKDKDYEAVTVEENPYEEVKKQTAKEKE